MFYFLLKDHNANYIMSSKVKIHITLLSHILVLLLYCCKYNCYVLSVQHLIKHSSIKMYCCMVKNRHSSQSKNNNYNNKTPL